jgi:hypothetical protein
VLAQAVAVEEAIAEEAKAIRGEATELTPALFLALWPLLRRPIPEGFLTEVGAVTGKPYASKGAKSIQVITDRMDNVLTPLWWRQEVMYFDEGKLCEVTVIVGQDQRDLFSRASRGGVNQASTIGNLYKGSYTNAAKRAFALVGVGHEVYLGATDLDPDVSPEAAKAQETTGGAETSRKLPAEKVGPLKQAVTAAGLDKHLTMKLRAFGVAKIEDLTVDQAISLYEWAKGEVTHGA